MKVLDILKDRGRERENHPWLLHSWKLKFNPKCSAFSYWVVLSHCFELYKERVKTWRRPELDKVISIQYCALVGYETNM